MAYKSLQIVKVKSKRKERNKVVRFLKIKNCKPLPTLVSMVLGCRFEAQDARVQTRLMLM